MDKQNKGKEYTYNIAPISITSEQAIAYQINNNSKFFTYFKTLMQDRLQVVKTIKSGLSNSFYKDLLKYLPLTEARWASIFNVSTKSLQRYLEGDHVFKPIHSEKLIEMTEVTLQGLETFGSQEKFSLWLHTPSMVFEGILPVDLLSDSYGKDLVLVELARIDNGIFA